MTIFKPSYYDEFCCIAGKCRHSCCVGWEIDVDEDKLRIYKNTEGAFGGMLSESISEEGEPHFILTDGERCPFLNEENLCDIIINMGEEALCRICREHPRFRNCYEKCEEIGIGLCCEEASRIIVGYEKKMEISGEGELGCEEEIFFEQRKQIFSILQDRAWRVEERCENLCELYGINLPQKDWVKVFESMERLDEKWNGYIKRLGEEEREVSEKWDTPFEQILVYFVYRHLQEGLFDGRVRERLLFAILSYKVIRKMFSVGKESMEELCEICRMYSCEIEYSEENTEKLLEICG